MERPGHNPGNAPAGRQKLSTAVITAKDSAGKQKTEGP